MSLTELEISETSALVGLSRVTIDSIIWVERTTGFPAILHFLIKYF